VRHPRELYSWGQPSQLGLKTTLVLALLAAGACAKHETPVGPQAKFVVPTPVPNPDLRADSLSKGAGGGADIVPGWPSRRIALAASADTDTVLVTRGHSASLLFGYSYRGYFPDARVEFRVNGSSIGSRALPAVPSAPAYHANLISGPSYTIRDTSTYIFQAILDPTARYSEVDEANNNAVLVVRGVLGDLYVSSIMAQASVGGVVVRADSVAVGQSVLLEGFCFSGAEFANVRIVMDVDGVAVVDTLTNFAPGGFLGFDLYVVRASWVADSPGTHIVTVRVDPDNLHPESSETNNQAEMEIVVTP
jgi:hypothetical protein